MDGYGKRVLVVDDDKSVRSLMVLQLEEAGYNVFQAGDGLDALSALTKRSFDVVVADYSMPIMNGLELLKRIRLLHPETPVILVSGDLQAVFQVGMGMQPFAWLRKPYERSVFLALIRSAVCTLAPGKRRSVLAEAT